MFALLAAGSKASPVTNAGPKRLWRKDAQVFHRAVAAGGFGSARFWNFRMLAKKSPSVSRLFSGAGFAWARLPRISRRLT
jgi:hypothetical protein